MTQATQDMLKLLREPKMESMHVSFMMTEVRKELERRTEWQKKFPVLRFYCDWCEHCRLDRNIRCETFIREMNRCLWQLDADGEYDALIQMNNERFLRIPELRNELGIVLTAMSGDIVYPSQTFILALFNYLKDSSVEPIDFSTGSLSKGGKKYNALCEELHIGPNRPLFKNIKITDVDTTCLQYEVEMDNAPTVVYAEVHFPICSEPSFIFAAERKKEEQFIEHVNTAQQLFQKNQKDDASSVLRRAKALLPEVKGVDELKARMYILSMEVEWSRTGELSALEDGKKAMGYIDDEMAHSGIYCKMGEYALQRVEDCPEALDKAQEYIDKSLSFFIYDHFKTRPMHLRGRILAHKHQWDEAVVVYNEAARYAEDAHNEVELAQIRCDMAYVLEMKGLPGMALAEYTHAEHIAQLAHHDLAIASCAFRKAQCLIRQGDKDSACMLIANMPQII